MTQATRTRKIVTNQPVILLRYFVKASKRVCCKVNGSQGNVYSVILESDGRVNCDCDHYTKGHKVCKHIRAVQIAEENRPKKAVVAPVLNEKYDVVGVALQIFNQATNDLIIGDAYEVLAPMKKIVTYASATGSCGHYVKPEHAGTPCGACLCK